MVCLGAFTINFIVGGTIMSFGLILISLLNYFGDSRSKTSWVGSVTDGMSLLSGPLVSFLLQRFTHREVVIFGTILSAFGFIISIWMPNVDFLIFTYGFIAGTGIGMAFITANVIIVLYFTSKRAIAVGIAMSGSGVGVFVYSFVVEALLQYYGWQGTILTLVGIILHIVICGAMFRPLQWILNKKYFSGSSRNSDPSTDSCYKDNSDISLISSSTLNNDYFYKNLSNQLEIPSHLKTAGNLSPARYHRKFSDGTIVSLDKNQFTLSSDPSIFKSILYPSHIRGHAKKTLSPSSNSLFMRSKRLRDPTLPSIFRGSTNLRCISMETIGALYSSSVLRDDKFEKSTSSSENSTSSFDFSMFTDVVMVFLLVAMTLST
ncbi:monocarboxylate transporter 9-like, partial [Octopus sinensis]|uniref:Monocarboxylate transporter 9-like n=1 Tax=Octopus sinensis TaxID=2607531 RepID=A0A6P7TZE4_9MOLL